MLIWDQTSVMNIKHRIQLVARTQITYMRI